MANSYLHRLDALEEALGVRLCGDELCLKCQMRKLLAARQLGYVDGLRPPAHIPGQPGRPIRCGRGGASSNGLPLCRELAGPIAASNRIRQPTMRNYEARLERIEATLKPEPEPELISVWVQEGETDDEALAKYAAANGVSVDAPPGSSAQSSMSGGDRRRSSGRSSGPKPATRSTQSSDRAVKAR